MRQGEGVSEGERRDRKNSGYEVTKTACGISENRIFEIPG